MNVITHTFVGLNCLTKTKIKSVQSALSDLLTTSATHGTFSRPSTKRGLISIINPILDGVLAHLILDGGGGQKSPPG